MLAVDTPDGHAYVIDVFRATGGRDHLLSFHGPPGEVTPVDLSLIPQPSGTYAGAGVPFAAPAGDFPAGYQYLYDVRRSDRPPDRFAIDYHADPDYRGLKLGDVHVRYHVLNRCTDVALAEGDPARNKPGNPRRITYTLLLQRGKTDFSSTFVSVIELYRATPFIRSVDRLDQPNDEVALRIVLAHGTTDTLVLKDQSRPTKLADGTTFDGQIAFVRRSAGGATHAVMIQGRSLDAGGVHLRATPALTGTVKSMNKGLSGGGLIWTTADLPTDGSLVDQTIFVKNNNERDACYTIHAVTKDGGLTRIDCGPITFVRSYDGPTVELRGQTVPTDYASGFLYDFDEGAPFTIPIHAIGESATRP